MSSKRLLPICSLLVFAGVQSLGAASITLFNTGVDGSGNVLAQGSSDPHWTMTASADGGFPAPNPAVVQLNHPAWLANDAVGTPGSSWISIVPVGQTNIAPGNYTVESTFNLTGLNPGTATIDISLASDNSVVDVELNGNPTGITQGGFGSIQGPFTINSGFVSGVNTLAVIWNNAGTGVNPGGVRIELSGTADVIPEPSGMLLLALGGGTLLLRRRRP